MIHVMKIIVIFVLSIWSGCYSQDRYIVIRGSIIPVLFLYIQGLTSNKWTVQTNSAAHKYSCLYILQQLACSNFLLWQIIGYEYKRREQAQEYHLSNFLLGRIWFLYFYVFYSTIKYKLLITKLSIDGGDKYHVQPHCRMIIKF